MQRPSPEELRRAGKALALGLALGVLLLLLGGRGRGREGRPDLEP